MLSVALLLFSIVEVVFNQKILRGLNILGNDLGKEYRDSRRHPWRNEIRLRMTLKKIINDHF
jgi:hypothetical protein